MKTNVGINEEKRKSLILHNQTIHTSNHIRIEIKSEKKKKSSDYECDRQT